MPPHPDRVRRNYSPEWWKDLEQPFQPPLTQSSHWHPSLWITAFVLLCFILVGYFVGTGQ